MTDYPTSIGTSDLTSIQLLGQDLAGDLMGQVGFGELSFWLVMQRRPTSGQLRTPLSGRVPPTDVDRLVMQRLNHPTPPQRLSVGREQYAGPSAGFKLD